ncbi:MAG: GMP synthase subunit A [Candidatus Verstraetearchaeota archaeon]|nr:GMP synthase subunit A [Candidatus Verstraetearchaeota archaeon]
MEIPVVFLGGQYNHLIVRALRELGVSSRLVLPRIELEELECADGLVMGGGPFSVNDGIERFGILPEIVEKASFPILGICLSHQLIGKLLGGEIIKGSKPEYGRTLIRVIEEDEILSGVGKEFVAWASHNDEVRRTGRESFDVLAESDCCTVEALKTRGRAVYGVQFHVEVAETPMGKKILNNFVELCRS